MPQSALTAIIVVGAIALLLFILLASSLTVDFEYDKSLTFRVKYLIFTFVMNPETPRRLKKKKRKAEKKKKKEEKRRIRQENKELREEMKDSRRAKYTKPQPAPPSKSKSKQKNNDDSNKQPINTPSSLKKDKPKKKKKKISFEQILRIIDSASPHVKRLFKKIRFYGVKADITVGGDDAAKVAVSYGTHCWIINSIVKILSENITFEVKQINIKADFDLEKTDYYFKGTVKLRLSTLLHSGIWGFFAVFKELNADASPSANSKKGKKPAKTKAA